jgi:predicted CoA-binding protein
MAIKSLRKHGIPVVALGTRKGKVEDVDIQTGRPLFQSIDTITLYISPVHQIPLYDYLISLRPRRILFNPGTENPDLEHLAQAKGITTVEACTLVLLSTGQYAVT